LVDKKGVGNNVVLERDDEICRKPRNLSEFIMKNGKPVIESDESIDLE